MPKFLQGKPIWIISTFALLALAIWWLATDVLIQLSDLHSSPAPTSLSDMADRVPPRYAGINRYTSSLHKLNRVANVATTPSAQPSPSPSEQPSENLNSETLNSKEITTPADDTAKYETAIDASPISPPYQPLVSDNLTIAQDLPAKENEEVNLQGVMVGNGTGIAIVEYEGTSYTVSPGDKVGSYNVTDIKPNCVTLERYGERTQAHIDVPQDAKSSQGEVAKNIQKSKRIGNHPPVLPPPESVPLPPQPVDLPPVSASSTATTISHSRDNGDIYNITELDLVDAGNIEESSSQPEITREELEEFTRKGAALMADIRGIDVVNGRGIKVEFRNADNALAKLGMRDGDVVTRINSRSVVGVEDIYNAVLTMRDAPQIDIEIVRNGQPMSLFHRFPEN